MHFFNTFATDENIITDHKTIQSTFMKSRILALLAAATLTVSSIAKVDYQVVPLPQSIKMEKSGKHLLWKTDRQPKTVIDLKSDNPELLENLIISAVNTALNNVREMVNHEMNKATGGFSIPGLM